MTDPILDILSTYVVPFLTGNFGYANEFKSFFQVFSVFVAMKSSSSGEKDKNWFHVFCIGLVTAFGGGLFTPLLLGRPSFLIVNDLVFGLAMLAYILVYVMPLGHTIGTFLPIRLLTGMGSTLFKSTGTCAFVSIANDIVKPSAYYPIPIFGPILWAILLANMGAFFLKGFHQHLQNGIPYPAQNGLVWASFYHFYVNDKTGIIGITLRTIVKDYLMLPTLLKLDSIDDKAFAVFIVSGFMQFVTIVQMKYKGFNPYNLPSSMLSSITAAPKKKKVSIEEEVELQKPPTSKKNKRNKNKNKKVVDAQKKKQ